MDSRTYLWLGYTVIAAVVFLTLFSTINRLSDLDAVEDLLSINLKWSQQVVTSSNEVMELNYKIGKNYSALFELPCTISVGKEGTPIFAGAKSFCIINHYDTLIYPNHAISSEFVKFFKEDKIFKVEAEDG